MARSAYNNDGGDDADGGKYHRDRYELNDDNRTEQPLRNVISRILFLSRACLQDVIPAGPGSLGSYETAQQTFSERYFDQIVRASSSPYKQTSRRANVHLSDALFRRHRTAVSQSLPVLCREVSPRAMIEALRIHRSPQWSTGFQDGPVGIFPTISRTIRTAGLSTENRREFSITRKASRYVIRSAGQGL